MSESNYRIPIDPGVAEWVTTLDENTREYFEERAGIAEFEGGMARDEAEQFAVELTLMYFQYQKNKTE